MYGLIVIRLNVIKFCTWQDDSSAWVLNTLNIIKNYIIVQFFNVAFCIHRPSVLLSCDMKGCYPNVGDFSLSSSWASRVFKKYRLGKNKFNQWNSIIQMYVMWIGCFIAHHHRKVKGSRIRYVGYHSGSTFMNKDGLWLPFTALVFLEKQWSCGSASASWSISSGFESRRKHHASTPFGKVLNPRAESIGS